MSDELQTTVKPPTLFRNYISFAGAVIVAASLASIILLFLIELTKAAENPYIGILTYIVLPGFLTLGIVVIVVGMLFERRRRRLRPESEIAAYPRIDLNDSRQRRIAFSLVAVSFIFIFMSAFGSYRAYEYSESVEFCGKTCHSVMKPEHVAFLATSHARIRCVDCHVGHGAESYARSKLNGARQLYSLALGKYSRPINSPVHNMRPANETCEQCHWPSKFYGQQLKTFNHYAYDEKNSLRQTRMFINVGGGNPESGPVAGIHWHMNLGNEVSYIATDTHRQVIPWISVKDRKGNVTEYYDRTKPLTADQISHAEKRHMDCIDCHNRPAHNYLPPDVALDQSIAAGRLDPSLPYLKREAASSLSQPYKTEAEAVNTIAANLDKFYRTNYGELNNQRGDAVKSAISETQRIYRTYFFPEMKTNWETHPNNIGHLYTSGCFRCHDGEHVSNTGKVISNDCTVCHTVLSDSARPATVLKAVPVQHPVDLGSLADRKCETCHKANQPFTHPVHLGDISMFQCVECHQLKQ
ncbi:MAG TPA: NapC/NirT family cytochrome c [Pyrinomonadaceae bacterium]|nr:NapC/NirT family cytochrome c [Pyrinomonadaceae bacterium]